jgi:metal-sulfur cluster biosynthetic enzyme
MSAEDVLRTLTSAQDTQLGRNVVELGMVRGIVAEPG